MTEYKQINEKQIFVVMKSYGAGAREFIGAYWDKDAAKRVAAENISDHTNFTITLHSVTLHGSMIDKV